MQAEAGQTLDAIIQRKEMERRVNQGRFFWGVGNALGSGIPQLLRKTSSPKVLFSVMRARPKVEDSAPSSRLYWTGYVDATGHRFRFPPTVLILSKGETSRGTKTLHYALVCESDEPLMRPSFARIDMGHLRNVSGKQSKLGFSQVTAVVEHREGDRIGPEYEVSFEARLVPPYFVRLVEPRELSTVAAEIVSRLGVVNIDPHEWETDLKRLHRLF